MALRELTFYLLERPTEPGEGILGNANASIRDGKRDKIISRSSSLSSTSTRSCPRRRCCSSSDGELLGAWIGLTRAS